MANNSRKITEAINSYIRQKRAKKNQNNYIVRQTKTLTEMSHHGPEEIKIWEKTDLVRWYTWKANDEISINSFIREVKTVKSFWKWAYEKRIVKKMLAEDIVCPKPVSAKAKPMKIIKEEDVINSSRTISQRSYAAVVIMYTCGLRVTEVEKLRESHVPKTIKEKETTFLTVPANKGKAKRLVPIPNDVALLALDYLTSRKRKITTGEIFAELDRGNVGFTPSQLRDSAIQRWLESGENIHTVSAWAGHSSVSTTAKFIPKPEKIFEPKEESDAPPV